MRFSVFFLLILNTIINSTYGQKTLEQELSDSFLGLPVSAGYDSIINNGRINLTEGFIYLPLPLTSDSNGIKPSSVNHWAELDTFPCSLDQIRKCEIQVQKVLIKPDKRFMIMIKYTFKSKETMLDGFGYFVEKFKQYSLKTESEKTKSKRYEIVEECLTMKFKNENISPHLSIYYDLDTPIKEHRYTLLLMYYFDKF